MPVGPNLAVFVRGGHYILVTDDNLGVPRDGLPVIVGLYDSEGDQLLTLDVQPPFQWGFVVAMVDAIAAARGGWQ